MFRCIICLEERTEAPIDVVGDDICNACFVDGLLPDFERALLNESGYPPLWGSTPISIWPFIDQGLISAPFRELYEAKEEEYATLAKDRLYCACGQFLGTKGIKSAFRQCECCGRKTCTDCGATIRGRPLDHVCDKKEDEAYQAFKGLIKGRDYQVCTCGCIVQLRDGCNHVKCRMPACGRSFCYICGEDAVEYSNHWAVGSSCPKYNQPDAPNARFEAGQEEEQLARIRARVEIRNRIMALGRQLTGPPSAVHEGDPENEMLHEVYASPENQLRNAHLVGLRGIMGSSTAEGPRWMRKVAHESSLLQLTTHGLMIYVAALLGETGARYGEDDQIRRIVMPLVNEMRSNVEAVEHFPELRSILTATEHGMEGRVEALNELARAFVARRDTTVDQRSSEGGPEHVQEENS